MTMNGINGTRADRQSGFALVGFIAVLLPLVGLAGAVMLSMGGRNARLMDEIRLEKALLAAEAGMDEAGYLAATGGLVDGDTILRTLPNGASFTVQATLLSTDGVDNDGDTIIDDVDENVMQLIVLGTSGSSRRRIVGYLRQPPLGLDSPFTMYHQLGTTKVSLSSQSNR